MSFSDVSWRHLLRGILSKNARVKIWVEDRVVAVKNRTFCLEISTWFKITSIIHKRLLTRSVLRNRSLVISDWLFDFQYVISWIVSFLLLVKQLWRVRWFVAISLIRTGFHIFSLLIKCKLFFSHLWRTRFTRLCLLLLSMWFEHYKLTLRITKMHKWFELGIYD